MILCFSTHALISLSLPLSSRVSVYHAKIKLRSKMINIATTMSPVSVFRRKKLDIKKVVVYRTRDWTTDFHKFSRRVYRTCVITNVIRSTRSTFQRGFHDTCIAVINLTRRHDINLPTAAYTSDRLDLHVR